MWIKQTLLSLNYCQSNTHTFCIKFFFSFLLLWISHPVSPSQTSSHFFNSSSFLYSLASNPTTTINHQAYCRSRLRAIGAREESEPTMNSWKPLSDANETQAASSTASKELVESTGFSDESSMGTVNPCILHFQVGSWLLLLTRQQKQWKEFQPLDLFRWTMLGQGKKFHKS